MLLLLLTLRFVLVFLVIVFFVIVGLRKDYRRFCGGRHPGRHNESRYGSQEKRHGLDR